MQNKKILTTYFMFVIRSHVSNLRAKGDNDGIRGFLGNWYKTTTSFVGAASINFGPFLLDNKNKSIKTIEIERCFILLYFYFFVKLVSFLK